jgi:hypothetical protein
MTLDPGKHHAHTRHAIDQFVVYRPGFSFPESWP